MPQLSTTTSQQMAAIHLKSANKRIFRALLSLASAVLLVRAIGFLSQLVVSRRFGAGATMDAYFVAYTVPTTIALLIASAAESSIVPVYARVRSRVEKEQASVLFSTLLNLIIIGAAALTLLMFIFRQQLVLVSAPALDSFRAGLAISLIPFICPVLLLMAVISYLECILNVEGQFGWPAYAGLLVPLTTALFVLVVGNTLGVVVLAIGLVAGLCLQLCVIFIRTRRAKLVYRPVLDLRNPAIGAIVTAGWPILLGASISQTNPVIDQIFASFLSAGSISAIEYSSKIIGVFTGVIFASVARAVLPYLSRQATLKDLKAFKATLRLYLWALGIGITVLTVFTLILAHPLVQILFQRGAFSAADTDRTASTLIGFLIGLTPTSFSYIIAKAFSALGKNRVLMLISIFGVLTNAIFDYIFARFWQSQGIALATSMVYFCNVLIMLFVLRRMTGRLDLLTPPSELVDFLRKAGAHLGLSRRGVHGGGTLATNGLAMVAGKETTFPSFSLPYGVQRHLVRFGTIIVVFAVGVAGVFVNSLYALRLSLASVILFALMRYNFVLLLSWILINGPNAMPLFRGSNVLIGLTAPTLLLMTSMPMKGTIQRLPALGILFAYLLWAATTIGISPIGLGPALTAWVLRLDCLLVSILAINVLNTRRRMLISVDALLLVAAGIALYGIYGFVTKQNGIVDPTTSLFRITSIFAAAPALALFLSLIIPLALYRAFTSQGFKRIICSLSVPIFIVAAALTFTRAAFIYIPVSILIMAFFVPSRQVKHALLGGISVMGVITVLLATIGNVPLLSRFTNQDITTLNGRTYLWQAILNNFDATRLLGNGIRASDALLISLHIGINGQGEIGTSPHDLFLGTLYDHGIVGLILLSMVFIALAINLIAGMRRASGEHRMLFVVAIAALTNVLVQSFDSNDFWTQAISIYIWIIMVLPFALCWSTPEKPAEPNEDHSNLPTEPQLRVIQPGQREQVTLV